MRVVLKSLNEDSAEQIERFLDEYLWQELCSKPEKLHLNTLAVLATQAVYSLFTAVLWDDRM